jgi:hypothetical protein
MEALRERVAPIKRLREERAARNGDASPGRARRTPSD